MHINPDIETRVRVTNEKRRRSLMLSATVFTLAMLFILLGTLINVMSLSNISAENKQTLAEIQNSQAESERQAAQLQSLLAQSDQNIRVELRELAALLSHTLTFTDITPVPSPSRLPSPTPHATTHAAPLQTTTLRPLPTVSQAHSTATTSLTPSPKVTTPQQRITPTVAPTPTAAPKPSRLCVLIVCLPLR